MKAQKFLAGLGMIAAVALLTNCQGASFTSGTSAGMPAAKAGGQLMPVNMPGDTNGSMGAILQPGGSVGSMGSTGGSTACAGKGKSGTETETEGSDTMGTENVGVGTMSVANGAAGAGDYVCILAGPGESVKLGMTAAPADVLQGQNPVPGVLCMSMNACLNIASQAFMVQAPEFRGYCKVDGNPNVYHVTDAQLQADVTAHLMAPGH